MKAKCRISNSINRPWFRLACAVFAMAGTLSDGCRAVRDWVADAIHGAERHGASSLYFDRQLTSLVDAYLEYSGVFPQRGGPQHLIDFGTAYKPTPHQQLDFHCGFGLSSESPDYTIGFGYSARFQVIRSK